MDFKFNTNDFMGDASDDQKLSQKWSTMKTQESVDVSHDVIHERYIRYSNQTQSERDLSKTDYTYAKSFSYNRRIDRLKAFEWSVPNMSRKSIHSSAVKNSLPSLAILRFSAKDNNYAMNNTLNHRILNDYQQNRRNVTVSRRVTSLLKNMTTKLMDSVTPDAVKRVTHKCPSLWSILPVLLLTGIAYLMSQHMSSPVPFTPLQGITSDMSSQMNSNPNEKCSELTERLNTIKDNMKNMMTRSEVKSMIRQALAIYAADKTGRPDFALESTGGSIVKGRHSETYDRGVTHYRLFEIPFWSSSVSPRAVIQPTISPGECWAFRGSIGYLVIRLSQPIAPTGFSYEHIPKQISRDGNIDSAPKEFQVKALNDESDTSGRLLGNYVYEDNDSPMQYFPVEDPNPRPVEFVELVILSNHGHHDYTCLYRFRVHGKRVDTSDSSS